MSVMRIRYVKKGGHYHCRVFTAKGPDYTFAKCGELVFDEHEWNEVEDMFRVHHQFIEDGQEETTP